MNSQVIGRATTFTRKLRGFVSVALVVIALGLIGVILLAGAAGAAPSNAPDRHLKTNVNEPVTFDVFANEAQVSDNTLDYTQPESLNGTVSSPSEGRLTYTPIARYYGVDTFSYEVCSVSDPDQCLTTEVSVTVAVPLDALAVTFAVIQTLVLILAIRLLDPYEHEPLSLIGVMAIWGAAGATLIVFDWIDRVKDLLPANVSVVFGAAIAAPIVEETAKGAALVVAFLLAYWFSRRFGGRRLEGVTAGIVYGAAIGLGFAFTEDVNFGLYKGIGALVARRDYLGYGALTHALFTAVFGVGLGLAFVTRRKAMRVVWPVAGLLLAITLHALNNGLANLLLVRRFGIEDVASWSTPGTPSTLEFTNAAYDFDRIVNAVMTLVFVGAAVAIWLWLAKQRRVITDELTTEADHGLVSPRDIRLTPRYWRRQKRRWDLVRAAQLQRARAEEVLHVQLARLAFGKRRYDESVPSEQKTVADLRESVRRAKAEVRFARLIETRDADERARQHPDESPTDAEQVLPTS